MVVTLNFICKSVTVAVYWYNSRDWELRQEWATARENKRASANKYGF